jgi:hypothetical protein
MNPTQHNKKREKKKNIKLRLKENEWLTQEQSAADNLRI